MPEKLVIPNYPSNSTGPKDGKDEKRVVEKVISGTAAVRHKNSWSRFAETFLGDDIQSVRSYIFYDMIIPGIKEGILGGLEMLFFGSARPRGGRSSSGSRRNVDRASYMINYGSYSNSNRRDRNRDHDDLDERYSVSLEDISFDSRGDAEKVLQNLREDIFNYNEATVAAYYQYAGVSTNDYTAGDRGWTNLDMVIRPRRVRGGRYILDLPRPQQLA